MSGAMSGARDHVTWLSQSEICAHISPGAFHNLTRTLRAILFDLLSSIHGYWYESNRIATSGAGLSTAHQYRLGALLRTHMRLKSLTSCLE